MGNSLSERETTESRFERLGDPGNRVRNFLHPLLLEMARRFSWLESQGVWDDQYDHPAV